MKTTTAENIRKELKALADSEISRNSTLPSSREPTTFSACAYPNCGQWPKKLSRKMTGVHLSNQPIPIYYEETMLQGMIIGLGQNGTLKNK